MSEVTPRSGGAKFLCATCAQSLFGVVRHCPFCGARQVDQAISGGASTPMQPDPEAKPLTRWGSQAEEAVQLRVVKAPPAEPEQVPAPNHAAPAPAPHATPKAPPQPPTAPLSEVQPAKPPASVEPATTPSVPVPPKPVGTVIKFIGLLLMAGAGYAGWVTFLKPKPPDLCQQALESAAESMQANQYAQAKAQALGAVARCTGESQGRAKTVLKAATEAHAADEGCTKAVALIDRQIAEGRLKLARQTLDKQPGSCLNRQDVTASKQRLDANLTGALEKLTQAQSQLESGQPELARASVDEAERLDRDFAGIAKVRRDIALWRPPDSPSPTSKEMPSPSIATVPAPVTRPSPPEPQMSQADKAENSKLVECSVLVRAGQRALANNSYDEAMQSAREARAAIPNCPGAAELLQNARQSKDKARQSAVIQ